MRIGPGQASRPSPARSHHIAHGTLGIVYALASVGDAAGRADMVEVAHITTDETWTALADRCWRTVRQSGLPRPIRPGFWDNNARCCGTAGVLALACDRIVERGDAFEFANVLVDDLVTRAIVDDAGVRWPDHPVTSNASRAACARA